MKNITLVTIPLVTYHSKIYWCLYNQYSGKVREDLLNRPTGGKQIPFAWSKAMESEDDILILTDDKFSFEKTLNKTVPTAEELKAFLDEEPLPKNWLNVFQTEESQKRIVHPPTDLACNTYTYSEKKLLANSKDEWGLPGECANEWTLLLGHLKEKGYEVIHAYIPSVCAKGICYGTPFAEENGIYANPISIYFTDKDSVVAEYIRR